MARYWADQLSGLNIWIVGRTPPPYEVNDHGSRHMIQPAYLRWSDVPSASPDIVVLAVKWRRFSLAHRWLADHAPDSLVVSLMNGMGQEEALSDLPRLTLAVGSTTAAVTRQDSPSPGIVVIHHGQTWLPHIADPRESVLRDWVSRQRLPWVWVSPAEMMTRRWQKLVQNSVINPLTALANCTNGDLVGHPLWRLAPRLIDEARAVAAQLEVDLPQDMLERVQRLMQDTGNNLSSMVQDVRLEMPTEIEAINGYIARQAVHVGLSAPTHEALTRVIAALPTRADAVI